MGKLHLDQDSIRLEGISEFFLPLYVNEIQSRRVSCSQWSILLASIGMERSFQSSIEVMVNSLTTKANFLLGGYIWAWKIEITLFLSSSCSSFPVILQQRTIWASHRQETGNRLLLNSTLSTYNQTGDYRRLQRDLSSPAGFPIKPSSSSSLPIVPLWCSVD